MPAPDPVLKLPRQRAGLTLLAPGLALAVTLTASAWLLAGALFDVTEEPVSVTTPDPRETAARHTPTSPGVDYAALADSALFGRYDPAAATAAVDTTPDDRSSALAERAPATLPEAELGVRLAGVVFAPRARDRRAIVTAGGGSPTAYAIDDSLPGDAVIRFIEARRIVVEHAGELKSVSLPEHTLDGAGTDSTALDPAADAALPQAGLNATAARALALRRRAAANQP